jgi:hypothetical protein
MVESVIQLNTRMGTMEADLGVLRGVTLSVATRFIVDRAHQKVQDCVNEHAERQKDGIALTARASAILDQSSSKTNRKTMFSAAAGSGEKVYPTWKAFVGAWAEVWPQWKECVPASVLRLANERGGAQYKTSYDVSSDAIHWPDKRAVLMVLKGMRDNEQVQGWDLLEVFGWLFPGLDV